MCKVQGCTTASCRTHVCGYCKWRDSHRTSFCPFDPRNAPRRQCCANGCNLCGPHNHYIHVCNVCGLSDSNHRSSHCPTKQTPQMKALGKQFFVVPPGMPNPAHVVPLPRHHRHHPQPVLVQAPLPMLPMGLPPGQQMAIINGQLVFF